VISKLLAELGNRDKFFIATKTPLVRHFRWRGRARQFVQAPAGQPHRLLQIHNVYGLDELMPLPGLQEAGKIHTSA
jgi:hypothetical protein